MSLSSTNIAATRNTTTAVVVADAPFAATVAVGPISMVPVQQRDNNDNDDDMLNYNKLMIPYTYRFLALRLRLTFTKRRFARVEATYQQYLLASATNTTINRNHEDDNSNNNNDNNNNNNFGFLDDVLPRLVERSFSTLRREIDDIEQGQANLNKKALPHVREKILLHECFVVFLHGFQEPKRTRNQHDVDDSWMKEHRDDGDSDHNTSVTEVDDLSLFSASSSSLQSPLSSLPDLSIASFTSEPFSIPSMTINGTAKQEEVGFSNKTNKDEDKKQKQVCLLPMLNQGEETTTAIKRLIADFAGVPTGMMLHDIRTLSTLLLQKQKQQQQQQRYRH